MRFFAQSLRVICPSLVSLAITLTANAQPAMPETPSDVKAPPADAITAMGDKAGAKRRMIAAGVPTAPGYLGD
ncbi:MAG: hypothetical protein WCS43_06540, partial [Verrucomicrobiota bacterium]